MNIVIAFCFAFSIGFACRWLGVPLPALPSLIGVLLIATITSGYWLADKWKTPSAPPVETSRPSEP